jgi:pyruvate,orthophosphate dikinase
MSPRYVYRFGAGEADGKGDQKELLGGKGANLAEMVALGIPVPPGFTLTTEVCTYLAEKDGEYPVGLEEQIGDALDRLAEITGNRFGDVDNPLLVSVRSGSPASMPGMMDTILNLGLNDDTVKGFAKKTGDARFAYDCYRRFVAMYADVVMGIGHDEETDKSPFETLFEDAKVDAGVKSDADLTAEQLKKLITAYKIEILKRKEVQFPEDPMAQLWGAIGAVFASWQNERAKIYRRLHNIDDRMGTAVNIQAMVFGNMGKTSASGVAFTRNPSTGEPGMYGEFLVNSQGEDVVAGIRTPDPLERLEASLPEVHRELLSIGARLEKHFGDMQDLEFTVEKGRLWLLQTRKGKRTGRAMVRIAVDMVNEELIDQREAILRIEPEKLSEIMHPAIDPSYRGEQLAKGLPASPGAAIGRAVFTAAEAEEWVRRGEVVILVRNDTSPEDIRGMTVAAGILTARGGMTSHAAVVARGMGKCCVVGCTSLRVDMQARKFSVGGVTVARGDTITLDGSTGRVFVGAAPLSPATMPAEFHTLMEWVDASRRLRVRTNADTPSDAQTARSFGAEGVGLCRTEHMFFAPERLRLMRQMILASNVEERRQALDGIMPMQRKDFAAIFRVMDDLPVTIRLLDPPLHEFLPHTPEEIADVAKELGRSVEELTVAVKNLTEYNPMLGHRGCRLAITYPEIYEAQVQAIAQAAVEVHKDGVSVIPEIMIPLVAISQELRFLRERVAAVFDRVLAEAEVEIEYTIGTMVELPRACLAADKIAEFADFFSFGTNDLTQTTFGLSRDDASRFLPAYIEEGVLATDPFAVLDRTGVGALMRIAVEKGRGIKTKLKIGICGEHGGEPSSVEFCHVEGFDYVSCSPFRIPIARVAAARAALRREARAK